jgi:hypothetical protein
MDTASPLCGRDALDAVPTSLVVEALATGPIDLQRIVVDETVLSEDSLAQTTIGQHEIGTEETRILAPFGRTDFDDSHG